VEVGVRLRAALGDVVLMSVSLGLLAQVGQNRPLQMPQTAKAQAPSDRSAREPDSRAEEELQKGSALTRAGSFAEAIPHLLAARGRASNDYAARFNLSLCFVATGQPTQAIPILTALRAAGHDNADVNNLLAQAYVGDGQNQKALEALQWASKLAPENEKLYLFVADACMAKQEYAVGLHVVELGLDHLPNSAHLHYQRGIFLALLDDLDAGEKDFDQARGLAPETDIAFLAATQKAMFEGDLRLRLILRFWPPRKRRCSKEMYWRRFALRARESRKDVTITCCLRSWARRCSALASHRDSQNSRRRKRLSRKR